MLCYIEYKRKAWYSNEFEHGLEDSICQRMIFYKHGIQRVFRLKICEEKRFYKRMIHQWDKNGKIVQ